MSRRISHEEAKNKYEWEQHCQELNKAGIPINTIPRWKRRQQIKQTKLKRFIDMLIKREGHIEQKKANKKEKENVEFVQETTKETHT